MALNYVQLGKIAQDPQFQSRVLYALTSAAIAVYNEASSTTGHAARAAFARGVFQQQFQLPLICYGVATSSTIAAEATWPDATGMFGINDSDIANQISAMWNTLAGA